jgi:L-lactate dehydrogenase (cytochrome)
MPIINSILDLRERARRRLPRAIFEYADRGAYDEITLGRNRWDLDALSFRQRVLVDLSGLSVATTMLGTPVTMPLAIAPTGLSGLFYRDGEIQGCRAAQAYGIPFCLSTLSICSIEDVRAATDRPFWFQLYLTRDQRFNEELIERARAAQCSALMLTVDVPVLGLRRRDAKNGLAIPPRLTAKNAFDVLTRPAWVMGVLLGKRRTFGNIESHLAATGLSAVSKWIASQFDPSATWRDLAWVRARWQGKLIIKGILDPDDAQQAVNEGVDAIVVSNHGGRQLDSAPSSISVLPEIVQAAGGRCEVWFDGGIRSGQDILKAVALGARGCLIGKSYLYALAAMGHSGVTLALNILRKELKTSMALTGCTDIQHAGTHLLRL